jgi:hypothetical protein
MFKSQRPMCGATNSLPPDPGTLMRGSILPPKSVAGVPSPAEGIRSKTQELQKLVKAARGDGSRVQDSEILHAVGDALRTANQAQMMGFNDASVSALLAETGGAIGAFVGRKVDQLKSTTEDAKRIPDPPTTDEAIVDGIKVVLSAIKQAQSLGAPYAAGYEPYTQISTSMDVLIQSKVDTLAFVRRDANNPDSSATDADLIAAIQDVLRTIKQAEQLSGSITGQAAVRDGAYEEVGKTGALLFKRRLQKLKSVLDEVKTHRIQLSDDKVKAAASGLLAAKDSLIKLAIPVPNDGGFLATAEGLLSARERLDMVREATRSLGLEK